MPVYIRTLLDGFVMDVHGGNTNPGTDVIVYPQNNPASSNQLWTIDNQGYIVSQSSSLVLDFEGDSTAPGTHMVMEARDPNAVRQRWTVTSDGHIVNQENGLVLDVFAGRTDPATSVIAYSQNVPASTNQLWAVFNA